MKKIIKIFSIIAIFAFAVSLLIIDASAAVVTGTCGENVEYSIDTSTGVCTISGTGAMKDYKASGNLRPPFRNYSITSIVIEEGVTSIGNYVFYQCENLKDIQISSTVSFIGEYAFYRCEAIESITIPENVRSIQQFAFRGCTKLKNVTFEGFVGYMGQQLFEGASAMESVTFTTVASPMPYWSSSWNTNLLSTASVTWGNGTYTNPEYTEGLVFTHSNGSVVVSGYTGSATTVSIPAEYNAIPIRIIDEYAFYANTVIEKVILPESITSIRQGAFMGCSALADINIPNGLKAVGMRAFANCTSFSFTEYENGYYFGANGNPYYILCQIKDSSVESFSIHRDTKIVQGELFFNCFNLTAVNVPEENTNYKSVDGVLFSKDGKTLYDYPRAKVAEEYTVPDGVVSIEQSAFYNNKYLSSVTLPNTVQSINAYAFANCIQLSEINLSSALSKIRTYAFYKCVSLKKITIPSAVGEIASGAFSGCTNLAEVVNNSGLDIKLGATSNGSVALYAKVLSTSESDQIITDENGFVFFNNGTEAVLLGYSGAGGDITLPQNSNGLQYSIANYALAYLSNVTSITINGGVTTIGNYAFAGCENLTSAVIGEGVASIGLGVFENCSSLENITLPFVGKSETEKRFIGYPFGASGYYTQNNSLPASLKNVTITGSAAIVNNAFYGCTGLEKIILSNNVSSIGYIAFEGCSGLSHNIYKNGKYIGSEENPYLVFVGLVDNNVLTLEINADVKLVLNDAINGANALTSITLSGANEYYSAVDGVLIDNVKAEIVCYPSAKSGTTYTVPSNVTSIGAYAFAGNKNLESVVLHNAVTSIGTYAFYDCDGLKSFTVPESVTLLELGILHSCDNIETLTIYKMKARGEFLGYFFGTKYYQRNNEFVPSSLKTVNILGAVEILDYAFFNCRNIKNIYLNEGLTKIGMHAFSNCVGLEQIALPSTLQSIGYSAFIGCSSIKSIEVPNSVTSIGISAFNGCSSLESIELPFVGLKGSYSTASLRTTFGVIFGSTVYDGGYVARQNFMNSDSDNRSGLWCIPSSLKNVSINGGTIYYGAFMNVRGVEDINIAKNVAFFDESLINAKVFSGCSSLSNINIENGHSKYSSESGLLLNLDGTELIICPSGKTDEDLKIPVTLTSIPSGAFANCTKLTSVEIPDTVTSIGTKIFSGCTSLEKIKLPFIGPAALTDKNNAYDTAYLLGTLFDGSGEDTSYSDKYTSVYQYMSDNRNGYYLIPNSLKTVIVTGGESGAVVNIATFYNCTMLESIVLGSNVISAGENAFYGCSNATVYLEASSGIVSSASNPNNLSVVYNVSVDDFFTSTLEKVTVSFTGEGVTLESIQTTGKVTLPLENAVTAPEGKILSGWTNGVNTYAPGEIVFVSAATSFEAVYANCYAVTFEGEGVETYTEKVLDKITLPTLEDRLGYSFIGWSNGNEIISGGTEVAITENVTFTAVWAKTITVTINYGYEGSTSDVYNIGEGESFDLTQISAVRDGYVLAGWTDGSLDYATNATVENITANKTFTAIWATEVNLLPEVCELEDTTDSSFKTLADLTAVSGVTYSNMVNNGNKLRGQNSYLELRNRGDTPWTDQYLTWGGYALNDASAQLTVSTCFYLASAIASDMSFFIGDDVVMSVSSAVVTLGGVEKGSVATGTKLELSVVIADPSAANPTAVITLGDYTETITLSAPIETLTFGYVVDFNNSEAATRIYYVRAKQYIIN